MRRLIAVFGLECYAVLLALLQYCNGVRTDEAKYLLNIPYPHPPLARFLLHTLDAWAYQEIFWRIFFASLLVQSVWLVLRLIPHRPPAILFAIACSWLFSAALLYQAGTIMMSVLTACEMMVCVSLWMQEDRPRDAGLVGLLWLASLFTAYQALLFAPLVWALLSGVSRMRRVFAFFLPLFILGFYTLINPFVVASILVHAGSDSTLSVRFLEWVHLWFLGGSIVLSILGVYGMIRCRLWPVLLSFLLVAGYVCLSRADYYAVLFLPLLMAGCIALVRTNRVSPHVLAMGVLLVSTLYLLAAPPIHLPSPARRLLQMAASTRPQGVIYIYGEFGHEWQYESRIPVLRYMGGKFTDNDLLVCTVSCSDIARDTEWRPLLLGTPSLYVHFTQNGTSPK